MITTINNIMDKVNAFLDRYVLPWPVRFLTFRFVILITIALLVPLILFDQNTVFVLLTNSYLNVMSVAVSSIVLLYATISETRQKQIAELQEKRAMEDHMHVTQMHTLILQTLQNQNKEMSELKCVIATLAGKEVVKIKPEKLPDIKSMHPRGKARFTEADVNQRLDENLYYNALLSTIRNDLSAPGESARIINGRSKSK
jgi:hypothetical protein